MFSTIECFLCWWEVVVESNSWVILSNSSNSSKWMKITSFKKKLDYRDSSVDHLWRSSVIWIVSHVAHNKRLSDCSSILLKRVYTNVPIQTNNLLVHWHMHLYQWLFILLFIIFSTISTFPSGQVSWKSASPAANFTGDGLVGKLTSVKILTVKCDENSLPTRTQKTDCMKVAWTY